MNIQPTLKKTLHKYKGQWPFIAREAGVSYSWMVHVMAGRTPNPRVNQVQAVLDVLQKIEEGELAIPE